MSRRTEIGRYSRTALRRLDRTGRRLARSTRRGMRAGSGLIETLPYRGWGRSCPVCGRSSRRFLPHGSPPRDESRCLHCDSLERHRFAWMYLQSQTDLFDGRDKTVLHFAPEGCFEPRLRAALGSSYVTADLMRENVDVTVDVTDIQYPDGSFDVILCSHVLEHVPDDRRAMRELARVLKDDGWMLLMVPMKGRVVTYEDPSIVDPEERIKAFGQFDHVRWYGDDLVDRLEEAGFVVTEIRARAVIDPGDKKRLGLDSLRRRLFLCETAVG